MCVILCLDRGVTLGRSELQKVFDGGVSSSGHVSPKPQRSKSGSCQTMDSTSELGKMLLKQTNKIAEVWHFPMCYGCACARVHVCV